MTQLGRDTYHQKHQQQLSREIAKENLKKELCKRQSRQLWKDKEYISKVRSEQIGMQNLLLIVDACVKFSHDMTYYQHFVTFTSKWNNNTRNGIYISPKKLKGVLYITLEQLYQKINFQDGDMEPSLICANYKSCPTLMFLQQTWICSKTSFAYKSIKNVYRKEHFWVYYWTYRNVKSTVFDNLCTNSLFTGIGSLLKLRN